MKLKFDPSVPIPVSQMNRLEPIEALWEIVQELAEADPYIYNDNIGKMECLFCTDSWGWGAKEKHEQNHDAECLAARARKLVEQRTKG